jgi:hypothetical protein
MNDGHMLFNPNSSVAQINYEKISSFIRRLCLVEAQRLAAKQSAERCESALRGAIRPILAQHEGKRSLYKKKFSVSVKGF